MQRNPKKHRQALLEMAQRVVADGVIKDVIFGFTEPPPPGKCTMQQLPRLMVFLTGEHHVWYADGSERREVFLQPGQTLYMLPSGWTRVIWDRAHTMFGVVFHPTYTRFLWYQDNGVGRRLQQGPDLWYHTAFEMTHATAHMLETCNALARQNCDTDTAVGAMNMTVRLAIEELLRPEDNPPSKARITWETICAYIQEACDQPLDRSSVASRFRLHPNHLSRLFRQQGNESFSEYLTHQRIERAKTLLRRHGLSVDEVAERCGFNSASYFIKVFHRLVGVSPGRFRE